MITSEQWQQMEAKLQKAVGLKINMTSMAILRSNHVEEWLESGYDLDLDIIPGIKKFMASFNGDLIHSWRIFDGHVKNAYNRRQRRKSTNSPYVNSKNWDAPDPEKPSAERRNQSVADWEKIKANMDRL